MKRLIILWQNVECLFYFLFGRKHLCGCSHTAKWKTKLTINGERGIYTLTKKPEYCPQCWAKAAIKCAWCGKTILPGDAITLYTPTETFKIPEYAVVYKRTPHLQLVGCLGWNCAESGMHRTGFWIMPGKVQRVQSPMETAMARSTNGIMEGFIVNDLNDPNEAILVPDEVAKPGE